MSLKLFASGDMVNYTGNKTFLDKELISIIKKAEVSICNFEAPLKIEDSIKIKKAGPHLFQHESSIEYLKDSGFNYVSLANNHIFDYGYKSLSNTINQLKKNSIEYIGAGLDFNDVYKTKFIDKNGIKIALVSACENEFGCLYEEMDRGGYAWIFHTRIEDNIRELKNKTDYIILVVHAGIENINFPIKEWRDKYKRFCDIGVDVIIGHHPHVPQGFEWHKDSIIFYSLGNLYFDTPNYIDKSDDSYSVLLEFNHKKNINFELFFHKKINGMTTLVNENKVNFKISKLNSFFDENYHQLNDDISLKLYNDYYKLYYYNALGAYPKGYNYKEKIKFLIKKFLNIGNKDKMNLLLLHNIRIESHRFLVQRAIHLQSEKI